jgi:hypothetical protein
VLWIPTPFSPLSRAVLSRDFWVRYKKMSVITNECAKVNADWFFIYCKISDLNNKWPDYLNIQKKKRYVRLEVFTDVTMNIAVSCDKQQSRSVSVACIVPTLRREFSKVGGSKSHQNIYRVAYPSRLVSWSTRQSSTFAKAIVNITHLGSWTEHLVLSL